MSHYKRRRPRFQRTARSRSSRWNYPIASGAGGRQALPGALRRMRAAAADLREYLRG